MEQAGRYKPHVGHPGTTAELGRRNERLDQVVLVIAQGLTGTKVSKPGHDLEAFTSATSIRRVPPSKQPSLHFITIPQTTITTVLNGL